MAHSPPTDADLLLAARSSPTAFRTFYDRHAERLCGFLTGRTRDATTGLELTAETFAQAWLSRDRFRDSGDGNAAPWLFGIARNLLANSVRRRAIERAARDRLGLLVAADAAQPDPSWLAGMDEELAAALADLPVDHRRAVELRVIEDRGYDDVASTLGITAGAARVRVHRGLAQMRKRLTTD